LTVLQGSEFGPFDQQGEGGGVADAWVGFDETGAFGVDGGELILDLGQALGCLAFEQSEDEVLLPVLCRDAVADQGVTCGVQFAHLVESGAEDRAHGGFEQGAETGQHGGVDLVGLGAFADCLGEAPCLAWVDLDHRQASTAKGAFEGAVIGAGGFEDDAGWRVRSQPGDEGCEASGIVGEAAGATVGVQAGVEMVFGDVDAGGSCYRLGHLFHVLCLSSGS